MIIFKKIYYKDLFLLAQKYPQVDTNDNISFLYIYFKITQDQSNADNELVLTGEEYPLLFYRPVFLIFFKPSIKLFNAPEFVAI